VTEAPNTLLIPTHKVGTPFQSPSWRAEALFHPQRFGLQQLTSEAQRKRSCSVVSVSIPDELNELLYTLTTRHRRLYLSLVSNDSKVIPPSNYIGWNLHYVGKLNDVVFKAVIEHKSGYKYDADIAFALMLGTDERQGVMAKMLSYSIFLGKSDVTLFKEWQISPKRIAWYRHLFADFTQFPRSNVAKWSVFRQLANNSTISEVDFNYFKRISELGDVALKAHCAFHTLTDEERTSIEAYLGNTAIVNVLDQHTAIRTADDSRQYTKGVMEFAKLSAQKQHMRNVELTIRMNSAKLEQIQASDNGLVSPEEQKLLDELYKRSLVNSPPLQVKTIADLK
jgi:hypothetical protein